jgi:exopolysaccharide production protein ExoY
MPSKKTPVAPRSVSQQAKARPVRNPGSLQNGRERRGREVVIVGAAADLPRALEHPAFSSGRMVVSAALGLDVESAYTDVDGLAAALGAGSVRTILVAGPLGPSAMRRVADLALTHHCELLAVMPTEVLAGQKPIVVWTGESPLVKLNRPDHRRWQFIAKRVADVVLSVLALVLAAPIIALLAVIVSVESHGSPIFRHRRIGLRGQPFDCLKLRTMRADAEERLRADPVLYEEYRRNHFKIQEERDPRVTQFGAFLRKSSLDELPQLWNVLRGDMSLVGPRPLVQDEIDLYGEDRGLLLSVRPGITGAWAVSGRHDVGYPDRCAMELDYVRHWSLVEDLRIALRTVRVVLRSA